MKPNIITITILVTLSLACSLVTNLPPDEPGLETLNPNSDTEQSILLQSEKRCGDGICDGPENAQNCPDDCSEEDSTPPVVESGIALAPSTETHWVVNPTSGANLFVQIITPEGWNGEALPALVLIPGGSGDSSHFSEKPQRLQFKLEAGFALVVFDPDGRGNSEGQEDDNGYTHQDGLAAVIEFAASLPEIDADRMGLVSYSYGITMASGTLARHPDLPIRFLIDWEGPANRNDTGGCDEDNLGHLIGHPCDDEDFWSQREASSFALKLQVSYQRLQSEQDHVQPDNDHAILMINNATSEDHGGHGQAHWTRLNDLQINQVYDPNTPPPMLSDEASRNTEQMIVDIAKEILAMENN